MPEIVRVAAAVIWRGDRLLITQRHPGGPLGSMWEFPGGKLEAGETPAVAIVRELREELGVEATVLETLRVERYRYPHGLDVEITFLRCTLDRDALTPGLGVHAFRWVAPGEIDLEQVLAADRPFVRSLNGASP